MARGGSIFLSCALVLVACTVSPPPAEQPELVSLDAPIYEKSLRDIDPADLRLDRFWIEGGPPDPEPVPLTARTIADLVERLEGGVVNLYTRVLEEGRLEVGIGPNDLLPIRIPLLSPILDVIPFKVPVPYRQEGISLGSGFVLNYEGYILTNAHVVHNATDIRVVSSDSVEDRPAKIVGFDHVTDVALIRTEPWAGSFQPLRLGSSNALDVGEFVVAVGNPLGLRHTVTSGLVSAKERVLRGEDGQLKLLDLIQTDSAINPGSSGGPLLNLRGEVVGINTALASGAQGIGFAVPIDVVKEVMPLLVLGRTERGWIGASVRPLEPDEARAAGLERPSGGVLVTEVDEAGPARAAGLGTDDVVVGVNGERLDGFLHFRRKLLGLLPEQTLRLTVLRGGAVVTVDLEVAERPG